MKTIPLTQGQFAFVDDADFEWLNQWKWRLQRGHYTFYAIRSIEISKNKRMTEYMHRIILGLQPGDKRQGDHRDGNGLNNQISNLRICTHAQNQQYQNKQRRGTSRYKGVCWNYNRHQWQSGIRVNKKQIHLGLFDSEIEAALAYNYAALKHFADFAIPNII